MQKMELSLLGEGTRMLAAPSQVCPFRLLRLHWTYLNGSQYVWHAMSTGIAFSESPYPRFLQGKIPCWLYLVSFGKGVDPTTPLKPLSLPFSHSLRKDLKEWTRLGVSMQDWMNCRRRNGIEVLSVSDFSLFWECQTVQLWARKVVH